MPSSGLIRFLLLPELKLSSSQRYALDRRIIRCEKTHLKEYCPRCATPSESIYDHRQVLIKDAPLRTNKILLAIRKRRLWCKVCKKPFTESIAGVGKGKRHTERFEREVRWACDTFSSLKAVRHEYKISACYVYKTYYRQLELRRRSKLNPWPKTIGIDEHSFKRNNYYGHTEFASVIVDYPNSRIKELVEGKTAAALESQLAYIPGRENVQNVVIDMCDPFKSFARSFFPNAKIVADKFHVLRLLSPAILSLRREITGTKADRRARKLLLMSSKKLDYDRRWALKSYLERYPELAELYYWKEQLHRFYRTRGYHNASRAIKNMIDRMSFSAIKQVRTLRKTLIKWKEEILNYFLTGLTNGRTEGFNNKAKLVKRMAYGYKSFENYRLRLLNACS